MDIENLAFLFFLLFCSIFFIFTYVCTKLLNLKTRRFHFIGGQKMKKRKKSWAFILSWQQIRLYSIFIVLCLLVAFVFYSISKTFQIQINQSSSYIASFFAQYDKNKLIFLLEQENRYYGKLLDKDKEEMHISSFLLEMATGINLRNPSSFLMSELPGFRLFDVQVVIDDGESNFSNISNEPIPDLAEIETKDDEKQAEEDSVLEKQEKEQEHPQEQPQNLEELVYIYHTHNRESFKNSKDKMSENTTNYSKTNNITLVGSRVGEALQKHGIGAKVDLTDLAGQVIERNLNYAKSYDVSRETVQKYLKSNKQIAYIFDIHRDAIKRDLTTIEINGKNYARIVFVIGGENKNYKKNLQLATELHEALNKKYKGISRNIVIKSGAGVNGIYNQDLSPNALTVEIGGVDNSLDEFYRTAEVFAEVFSDYYKKGLVSE